MQPGWETVGSGTDAVVPRSPVYSGAAGVLWGVGNGGLWVRASPQDIYTSGTKEMAEPGTVTECGLVPNEC